MQGEFLWGKRGRRSSRRVGQLSRGVPEFRRRGENEGKSEGIGGYRERRREGLEQGEGLGGERENWLCGSKCKH